MAHIVPITCQTNINMFLCQLQCQCTAQCLSDMWKANLGHSLSLTQLGKLHLWHLIRSQTGTLLLTDWIDWSKGTEDKDFTSPVITCLLFGLFVIAHFDFCVNVYAQAAQYTKHYLLKFTFLCNWISIPLIFKGLGSSPSTLQWWKKTPASIAAQFLILSLRM